MTPTEESDILALLDRELRAFYAATGTHHATLRLEYSLYRKQTIEGVDLGFANPPTREWQVYSHEHGIKKSHSFAAALAEATAAFHQPPAILLAEAEALEAKADILRAQAGKPRRRGTPAFLAEALNSGDGTYRP
jgi:hypothetical protein